MAVNFINFIQFWAYIIINFGLIISSCRPYSAIDCAGLKDLCIACMTFGQNNKNAKPADLLQALPTRNTVKAAVHMIADENRKHISKLMKSAVLSGGLAATTDCWTDDYRKRKYICVVVHISLNNDDQIKFHKFVLSTSEVTAVVKSGLYLPDFFTSPNIIRLLIFKIFK